MIKKWLRKLLGLDADKLALETQILNASTTLMEDSMRLQENMTIFRQEVLEGLEQLQRKHYRDEGVSQSLDKLVTKVTNFNQGLYNLEEAFRSKGVEFTPRVPGRGEI